MARNGQKPPQSEPIVIPDNLEVIHFGIDYLRYNFFEPYKNSEFASFFIGLSENSNYRDAWWFGYHFDTTYARARSEDILHFKFEGVPVFQLKKYNGQDEIGSKLGYSFDFYSAFYAKPFLRNFYREFMRKYGSSCKVGRLDIAVDLSCQVQDVLVAGYKTNYRKLNRFGEDINTGEPETVYFGSKSPKNKRHFVRIYDKLLDSKQKGKFELYRDYFSYNQVTRIEVEIRSSACRELSITTDDIADEAKIKEIFTSLCLNPRTTYFNILGGLGLESKELRKLSADREQQVLAKDKKVKRVVGMIRNLKEKDGLENVVYVILLELLELGIYSNPEDRLAFEEHWKDYKLKIKEKYSEAKP